MRRSDDATPNETAALVLLWGLLSLAGAERAGKKGNYSIRKVTGKLAEITKRSEYLCFSDILAGE